MASLALLGKNQQLSRLQDIRVAIVDIEKKCEERLCPIYHWVRFLTAQKPCEDASEEM